MSRLSGSERRWVCAALVVAGVAAVAAAGRAGERIERFLPANTFLYGGVEQLEAGFDKLMAGLHRALPDVEVFDQERFIPRLARELDLAGVATREDLLAATGLDPRGSAGIAWVLCDPTSDPGRSVNENVLLILPVREAARAERLLADKFLPELAQASEQQCRAALRHIQGLKQRWRRANPDAEPAALTWQHLAKLRPGLQPLRCPAGGTYTLGHPDEAPTCSLHAEGREARFEGPFTREGLGVRTVGDVTLVGGRKVGTGYALAAGHLLVSNHMTVLEAAVNAAAGQGPRAAMPPPEPRFANADGRAFAQTRFLLDLLRQEMARWAARRGPTPAAERLATLFAGGGALAADLRIDGGLTGALSWQIARNPQTARVLDKAPSRLEAFTLVPDTALAAWGANVTREAFSVIGDIVMIDEPQLAAAAKLVMAGADGDGAFAFTQGSLQDELPNLLFILRVRDREAMDAAAQSWLGIFGKEFRQKGQTLRRGAIGGTEVWSLEGLRRGASLHYAFVGPFAVFGSKLDDIRSVLALHAGAGGNALVGGERFRKLGLPGGPANAVSFVDMPALIRQIAEGQHEQRLQWRNRACQHNMQQIDRLVERFRRDAGRLPANLDELALPRDDGRRAARVRGWCMMLGEGVRLTLDPNTGKVSCPRHGTVANFRPLEPDEPRRVDDEETIFSAFGLWALRLRVDGDRIVADGRLIPVPQRRPKPKPRPTPQPRGPAEF